MNCVISRRQRCWRDEPTSSPAGGVDETRRAAEVYEFLLRLLKLVPAIAVMQPLLHYRRHAGQATAKGTAIQTGFFAVARRVEAAPENYPAGKARSIARTGGFDSAVQSFSSSVGARWIAGAALAMTAARICRSSAGRSVFDTLRTLWKRRPAQR